MVRGEESPSDGFQLRAGMQQEARLQLCSSGEETAVHLPPLAFSQLREGTRGGRDTAAGSIAGSHSSALRVLRRPTDAIPGSLS